MLAASSDDMSFFHVLSPNVAFQLPTHQLNLYTPWILSQRSKNGFQRTWDQTRTRCHLSSNVVAGNSNRPRFSGKWSQRSRNVNMFKGSHLHPSSTFTEPQSSWSYERRKHPAPFKQTCFFINDFQTSMLKASSSGPWAQFHIGQRPDVILCH